MSAGERLPGTPEPMHRWTGAYGLSIAGDSWGEPGAQPVILMHGGGQTRHAWKGAGERLAAAGYHAVAPDARGHGDSEWSRGGHYGPDVMAEDLRLLIRALGGQPPVLVGASMGGSTSLLAVGEGRVEAAALVLVDIAPRIETDGVQRIMDFMRARPDGFDSLEQVADAIAAYQPQRRRPRTLDGLAKNVRRTPDGRYRWHWDPNLHIVQSDAGHREERRVRFEAAARRVGIPTLLVRGALSDLLSEEGARHFLELCPQSEYVNVAGAAHMVAGDRNDIFARAVEDFIGRRVPPRRA